MSKSFSHVEFDLELHNVLANETRVVNIDFDKYIPLSMSRKYRFYYITYGTITIGMNENGRTMELSVTTGNQRLDRYQSATPRYVLARNTFNTITLPFDYSALYKTRDMNSDNGLNYAFGITPWVDPDFWVRVRIIYCFSNEDLLTGTRRQGDDNLSPSSVS